MKKQVRIRPRPRSAIALRSLVLAVLQCVLASGLLVGTAWAGTSSLGNATTSGSNLVVFRDAGIKGAFVSSQGTVGPTFSMGEGFSGHSPTTATDGTDHLVVWEHSFAVEGCTDPASSIMGAIVRSEATVSVPFMIASWNGPCDVQGLRTLPDRIRSPRVGFDGTNYFVVWETFRSLVERTIDGARVTPDGTVLDPGGKTLAVTALSDYLARPRLAFDGTNFLVVYLAGDFDVCFCAGAHGIFATRVNTLSAPVALDPAGIPISAPIRHNSPEVDVGAVAFDGLNWVVTWTQDIQFRSDTSALMAARVTSAGAVLDPLGMPVVSEPNEDVDELEIASDGANLLVVLYNSPDSSSQAVLIDSRSTGFEIVKPLFSVPLIHTDAGLSVDQFLVVGDSNSSFEVAGMRIGSHGELIDAEPFPISQPDTTAPETSITSAPAAVSNSTTASFEFTANEGAWFECRVDSAPFSSCSSPMTYADLAEGDHTFEVFATDLAGNVDTTPALWSWTIDTSAPDTSITSGPQSLTNETTATFSFGATEDGAGFECKLDEEAFSTCSSPTTYTGLGDGAHSFEVRALDAAGNVDATSASWWWTIDSAAPGTVTLASPTDGASTSDSTPSFDWGDAIDRSLVTYEIQVDDSGSSFPSPEIEQGGLTTSDFTPTDSLAAATYSWRVRATDAAGNVGAWSEVFTVTITGPTGAIAGKVTSQSSRKPLAGATVDCGAVGKATTASDGTYAIANVIPGSYVCTASASGHKPATKSVTVIANRTTSANFALKKA